MKMSGACNGATRSHVVSSSSKFWCDISFSAFALLAVSSAANAQTNLTWDVNGAGGGTGGAGTWNTTAPIWFNGAVFVPWSNGGFDNAIFGGTAGTVTVGGTINVHNITFNTPNYTLTGGTLNLGGTTPTISGTGTINSVLAGAAGITTGGGVNTLTFSGANTFIGPLIIGHGILSTSPSTGSVILSPTASLATSAVTIGNNPLNGIIAVLQNQGNNQLPNATVTFNAVSGGWAMWELLGTSQSVVGINDSSTAGIIEGTQSQTGIGNSTLTLTGTGSYSFNGHMRDNFGGSGTIALVKNGSGTQTLGGGGNINYTGPTTVNGGTLSLVNAANYRSPTTVNSGATLALGGSITVERPAGFSLTLNNGSTLNDTSSGFNTFGNSNVAINGTVAVNVTNNGVNNQLFIGGAATGLTGSGTINLTNTGSATTGLTFRTGAGNFSGAINVAGGVLNIGSGASLALQNTDLNLTNNARLNLTGAYSATAANASVKSLAGDSTATVVLGAQTMTLGTNNGTGATFAGMISGTGALIKTGTGTQTLTGNNSFTGTTSVAGGALAVNGRLCGTTNVLSGGQLQGTGRVCDTTNFTGGTIAPGNSIGTLTIAGNYTGNGGVLAMEGVLSGTGSPADRLLITGNATGTTEVRVTNLGGTGAQTGFGNSDGISIIQVGGASTASTFQLQGGYAAAGPYQYRLNFFAPGASAATQADPLLGTAIFGDYRLQSAIDASGAPIPVPQVPAYQSMPTGALRYGASLLDGLHKRLGEIRQFASLQPGDGTEDVLHKEFFLRGQSSRGDFSGDKGASFDQDIQFTQVGGNFVKWNVGEMGSTLRLGGALSFGRSDLSVKGSSAKVELKGLTLALMGTYQGARGEYLDIVAQGTQYRANVRTSERGNVGDPKGWGLGLSVEGGHSFDMGEALILEPQAQLAYQRVRFDRFTDVDNITVDLETGSSLRGRVGLRVQKTYETQGQQWSPYAEINLLHEFLKGGTIQASGVGFRSDSIGTGLQLGVGLNGKLGRDTTLFLTLGYEKGVGKGSADTLGGTLGMRMSF